MVILLALPLFCTWPVIGLYVSCLTSVNIWVITLIWNYDFLWFLLIVFPGNVNFQRTETKHDLAIRNVILGLLLKIALFNYGNSNSKNFKHSIRNKYVFSPFGFFLFYILDGILSCHYHHYFHYSWNEPCSMLKWKPRSLVPIFVLWSIWNGLLFWSWLREINNILK